MPFIIRLACLTLLFPLLVTGCGGSGSGSNTVAPATVGLIITDAAIDEWDQALATITSVELIGADDNGRFVLFEGEETVDLLRLRDYVEVFAINENVAPGTYEKIRLQLTSLELVKLGEDDAGNTVVLDSRSADLVANGKMDLNPRGSFDIAPGAALFITLDFDLKAFKLTEAGASGKLIVRPVIFVKIATTSGFRGLARFQGTIEELDTATLAFRLCGDRLLSWADPFQIESTERRCMRVRTDMDTGVFGVDGLPSTFAALAEGDEVTAIGRLEAGDNGSTFNDPIGLHAFTIEGGAAGTWQRVAGTAVTPVANDSFDLLVSPAQGFAPGTEIAALLYPQTRIFSTRGDELDRSAIRTGRSAVLDAVLAIEPVGIAARTALVIVDQDDDAASGERLTGTLLARSGTNLTVSTATGDRCVEAGAARVFFSEATGDGPVSIDEIGLADLQTGQTLDIFGTEGSGGCFDAAVIIAQNGDTED